MGASSAEINQQIASTRDHLDANLDVLEKRAASGMKRVGGMAAIGVAAGLLVGGIAFLAIRRMRRPSLGDRVHDALPGGLGDLREELTRRFGNRPFKVVITSGDAKEDTVWASTVRKVAPTVVTTAMSALMAQLMRRSQASSEAEQPKRR